MAAWIYTIYEPNREGWLEGTTGNGLWTDSRRGDTGRVIRRKDGKGAGQPRWRPGDKVIAYNPSSDRCFATLDVISDAEWDEGEETWNFDLEILKVNWDGPRPKDVGITITQGARKRLDLATYARVEKTLKGA